MQASKDIAIFKSKEGEVELKVNVEGESVWLTMEQMCTLFGRDKSTISRHIKNVYKTAELSQKETVAKNATVQKEGKKTVTRMIDYYNLDLVLSVGYRVNSKQGTQFRIWATSLLKQHLLKGYTLNAARLEHAKLQELKSAVSLIRQAMTSKQLTGDESEGLLKVITDYADTWLLLDQYDKDELPAPKSTKRTAAPIDLEEARTLIASLKKNLMRQRQASDLFGKEKDDGLERILAALQQTFDQNELYTTVEEKAAHLLYFVTKDHPFIDGNKRIAAFLFIVYLTRTKYVTARDGERKFSDSALVALVLLIAESRPGQKDVLVRLIMNFVHGK